MPFYIFNKGIFNGFKTFIPKGGQTEPKTTLGDKLAWKKAQKNEKKNITSEIIKSITPNLRPCWTFLVWYPLNVLSLITSLHQTNIIRSISIKPANDKILPYK